MEGSPVKTREAYVWPEEKAKLRRRAIRLEWAMLVAMASVVIVLYFVLGSSQAMRTAWTEDILGLVPAAAYLVAVSFERRGPTERFPFGFYRAVSVAYLVGATATLLVGAYLLADNAIKLVNLEHPTIGLMSIAGYEVWGGWVMMAALLYSILPPVVLGRLKLPVAREIHDKPLMADASMQKADWMTGLGAIVGIAGVGFGLWWADAAAALFISLSVIRDGAGHVGRAIGDLSDRIPHTVDRDAVHPAIKAAREAAADVAGVGKAAVKFREEGHLLTGVVYVEMTEAGNVAERMDQVRRSVEKSDWRLYDISVVPLPRGEI